MVMVTLLRLFTRSRLAKDEGILCWKKGILKYDGRIDRLLKAIV